MTMRKLTGVEIERLANRKNVRRVAVENFLGTMIREPLGAALVNLTYDARLYRWNTATKNAIRDGIILSAKK